MNNFFDVTSKLFSHNQATADLLKTIQGVPEEYLEALLAGGGISPSWRCRGKMLIFYTVINGNWFCFYFPSSPLPFPLHDKERELGLGMITALLTSYSITGVESPVSMDGILWKRYRGKLEHREIDHFETHLLQCHVDRLAVTPPPVTLTLEGSSATVGE